MRAPTVLETPCREWQGSRKKKSGYGNITREGRAWVVHRWVWTLANGPIPDGMKVLHRCDNPPCFRLDHLFLGTQADNVRDRDAKGRCGAGALERAKTHCPQGHEYTAENTYWNKRGHRRCRRCTLTANAERKRRKRSALRFAATLEPLFETHTPQ